VTVLNDTGSADLCIYSAYVSWQDRYKLVIALNSISNDRFYQN
jgi:hypothetical protein